MSSSHDVSELLSAYIDDELEPDERQVVDDALATDPSLLEELTAVRGIRQQVRDLPLLEMPADLANRIDRRSPFGPLARPRRRTRTRAAALSALVSVACWGVLIGTGSASEVLPDVAGVVSLQNGAESSQAEVDPDEMADVPLNADGFLLVSAIQRGPVREFLYSDGTDQVVVLTQRGRVDWDALPDGAKIDVGGSPGWLGDIDGHHALVVGLGETVYLITGSVVDDMWAVSDAMPTTDRSLFDRVIDASREVVDLVGVQP